MSRSEPKQSSQSVDSLTTHAYWVSDLLAAANNNMLQRSATLIGFLGIEIAFIANWQPVDFVGVCYFKWLFALGALSALVSFFSLILGSNVKKFIYPNFDQIRFALRQTSAKAGLIPLKSLLKEDSAGDFYIQLLNENKRVSLSLKLGTYFLLVSQFCFGSLLILRWINS